MRTRTRTEIWAASLLLMLGMMTLAGSSLASAQDVCPGFDRKHTITKLGGPNALAPGGLKTKVELQEYFAAHADEIRSALASQGLGGEVADALLAAIHEGAGISERTMREGERLEWMAYRKDGKVVTIKNVCLRLHGTAPAFEIVFEVVSAPEAAQADCSIEVSTDCRPGGASSFAVRTAPGARVTMEGPAGARTIIEGGGETWTGPIDDPYQADYSFTVTNEAVAAETVTVYTFLVPRECVNLAFVGRTQGSRVGKPVTCSERRSLSQPVCPVPPPPSCVIELDNTEVRSDEIVGYQVTGEWATLDLELMREGEPLAEPVLTAKSGTIVLSQPGTYTVVGTVTNELGRTESCRASFEVVGSRWITRPFATFVMVDNEEASSCVVPAKSCPCPADTGFGYDDGYGLGVSVERLFNQRIGLEARALYAQLDNEFRVGGNGLGITDSDTSDYWDLSLNLNIHLFPEHALDWYLGPFVGYGNVEGYTSLSVGRSLEYDAEGGITWGAQTGLDLPFGDSPLGLHLGARYAWSTVDLVRRYTSSGGAASEQSESIDINPITLELGVAYHF